MIEVLRIFHLGLSADQLSLLTFLRLPEMRASCTGSPHPAVSPSGTASPHPAVLPDINQEKMVAENVTTAHPRPAAHSKKSATVSGIN